MAVLIKSIPKKIMHQMHTKRDQQHSTQELIINDFSKKYKFLSVKNRGINFVYFLSLRLFLKKSHLCISYWWINTSEANYCRIIIKSLLPNIVICKLFNFVFKSILQQPIEVTIIFGDIILSCVKSVEACLILSVILDKSFERF